MRKSAKNLRDHKVSFETAAQVFDDPFQFISDNYFIDGEQRELVIGMTKDLVLLLVVFVDRSEPEAEVIHVISARKAEAEEERIYAEQIS